MNRNSEGYPSVSVCVPSYNYAGFLSTCIESVLRQTYQDFELIIVDDASVDESFRVAKSFRDPRIRVYRNNKRVGMIPNWNECVRRAHGKYVKMLMADDALLPECIETFMSVATAYPEAACISCLARYVDKAGYYLREDPCLYRDEVLLMPSTLALISKACGAVFSRTPTHTLVQRDALKEMGGYDMSLSLAADTHMHVKLMSRAPLVLIGKPLVCFRRHPMAASSDNYLLFAEMYRRIMTMVAELVPVKNLPMVRDYAMGHASCFAAIQGFRAVRKGRIRDAVRVFCAVPLKEWPALLRFSLLREKRRELLRDSSIKRRLLSEFKGLNNGTRHSSTSVLA